MAEILSTAQGKVLTADIHDAQMRASGVFDTVLKYGKEFAITYTGLTLTLGTGMSNNGGRTGMLTEDKVFNLLPNRQNLVLTEVNLTTKKFSAQVATGLTMPTLRQDDLTNEPYGIRQIGLWEVVTGASSVTSVKDLRVKQNNGQMRKITKDDGEPLYFVNSGSFTQFLIDLPQGKCTVRLSNNVTELPSAMGSFLRGTILKESSSTYRYGVVWLDLYGLGTGEQARRTWQGKLYHATSDVTQSQWDGIEVPYKVWVQAELDKKLDLKGGALTGRVHSTYTPTSNNDLVRLTDLNTKASGYLPLTGGTMASNATITLPMLPNSGTSATNRNYVDAEDTKLRNSITTIDNKLLGVQMTKITADDGTPVVFNPSDTSITALLKRLPPNFYTVQISTTLGGMPTDAGGFLRGTIHKTSANTAQYVYGICDIDLTGTSGVAYRRQFYGTADIGINDWRLAKRALNKDVGVWTSVYESPTRAGLTIPANTGVNGTPAIFNKYTMTEPAIRVKLYFLHGQVIENDTYLYDSYTFDFVATYVIDVNNVAFGGWMVSFNTAGRAVFYNTKNNPQNIYLLKIEVLMFS